MKNFIKITVSAVLFSSVLGIVSCGSKKEPAQTVEGDTLQGEISISGAFALYPLAVRWKEEFETLHPNVKISLSGGGAGKGMTDVLTGMVDLGMVSREVYPPEIEQGAVGFAVAKDAVVPTINANNPLLPQLLEHGLTKEAAQKLWITEEYKTWGQVIGTNDATPVNVYTRSDACGAAETWALWLGKKQEDLKGTQVFGDPGVAQAVQKDVYGIGLNNIGFAYDDETHKLNEGLEIIPVDNNENGKVDPDELFYGTKDEFIQAVAEDKYPSPPARDLYLVSKGIPESEAVVAFLEYVLTDGQALNIPVGYIGLSQEKLQSGLDKLHNK